MCFILDEVSWLNSLDKLGATGYRVILIIFVGMLSICSTYVAMYERQNGESHSNKMVSTLARFSFQKNISAIISMKERPGNLPGIHGIRSLSIAWIVLGHEYFFNFYSMNVNNMFIADWIQSWNSLYLFIAHFSVDTFFVLSGFLMTYTFLKQMPKQKSFNVPMYYLHRYFRLTPSVIAIIVITIVFVPKMGSGPQWDVLMSRYSGNCRTKWWPMLLYLQNFVHQDEACLDHLWYLAVDMQLFWISPIILYPLYKKPKLGFLILTGFIAASLITPAVITGYNEYRSVSYANGAEAGNQEVIGGQFRAVYVRPYCRAGPWLIGILLGYIVINNNRKLTKTSVFIGWLLTAIGLSFCTFGSRYFMRPDYEYDVVLESFFATVSRPIWGLAIAWIIFASIFHYAGPVSKFLSWKIFLPISRLSYCIYLLHFYLELLGASIQKVPSYFSEYYVWRSSLSDFVICLVLAFFFSLLFESPILALEKMLLRRKKESHHDSQKELRPASQEESKEDFKYIKE